MIKQVYRFLLRSLNEKLRDIGEQEQFLPFSPGISVSSDFIIGKYRNIHVENGAVLQIEEGVSFREFCTINVLDGGSLNINKYVFCNNYVSINCLDKITIGEYTLIGEGVKIYDHSHNYAYHESKLIVERTSFKTGEVSIGKNVWIGSNTTILKGVVIGDNVIIGANNLIYKSVPAGTIMKSKAELIIEDLKGG